MSTITPRTEPKPDARWATAMLVDAHEIMRIGMAHLLQNCRIDVVATCDSWHDAVRLAQRHQPDLVLMESSLTDGSAAAMCGAIRRASPRARIMILTARDCVDTRASCLQAGAHSYLLKDVGADELSAAIHALLRRRAPAAAHPAAAPLATPDAVLNLLSPQEKKIPPLVCEGKTNKEIASLLGLSDKTVKNYLSNIYLKLHVTRRSQLAAMFARSPPSAGEEPVGLNESNQKFGWARADFGDFEGQ